MHLQESWCCQTLPGPTWNHGESFFKVRGLWHTVAVAAVVCHFFCSSVAEIDSAEVDPCRWENRSGRIRKLLNAYWMLLKLRNWSQIKLRCTCCRYCFRVLQEHHHLNLCYTMYNDSYKFQYQMKKAVAYCWFVWFAFAARYVMMCHMMSHVICVNVASASM
jgi:hypothetical protein